jgi:hypothetical protein
MDLGLLQWPAMALTLLAAWLVGSRKPRKRIAGFACFLGTNVLWVVWGWHDQAYAIVALQFFLAGENIRGVLKNEPK